VQVGTKNPRQAARGGTAEAAVNRLNVAIPSRRLPGAQYVDLNYPCRSGSYAGLNSTTETMRRAVTLATSG